MKKKLITSALPYVNNVPHLGNIIGSVLSADVYARFCRLRGYDTLFICGTDEYGTATEAKAKEENKTAQEVCDYYNQIHKQVYEKFQISFDYFGRTSDEIHTDTTQELFLKLDKRGLIIEQTEQQLYCEQDQTFLADRYIEGTCPKCGYIDARGDQCDNCSNLLEPTDLIAPRCKFCSTMPVLRSTNHLYIDLPQLSSQLKLFTEQSIITGKWTDNAIKTTESWLKQGLQARPITRDLKWGIKVPKFGFENKVFYVWFDAVIGYISFTKKLLPTTWQNWWLEPNDVQLYQFMAKDNIPFHTIIFPAILIGLESNWTLLHHISSCEYLNYESVKFSKSRNIGVFGTDLDKIDFDIDWWRYYLIVNRPESADTNFSWHEFAREVNANFIDNIGNLINRVVNLINMQSEASVENDNSIALDPNLTNKHTDLIAKITPNQNEQSVQLFKAESELNYQEIIAEYEAVQLKSALKSILQLARNVNRFIQIEQPWKSIKTNSVYTHQVLITCLAVIRALAILLQPITPKFSKQILIQINHPAINANDYSIKIADNINWEFPQNLKLNQAQALFAKFDPEYIDQLAHTYSGQAGINEQIKAFNQLNIESLYIELVKAHPNRDDSVILSVKHHNKIRTIVAAIKHNLNTESLIGKYALFLTNIADKMIAGVKSEGMILTAVKKNQIEPLLSLAPGLLKLNDQNKELNSLNVDLPIFKKSEIKIVNGLLKIDYTNLTIEAKPIKTKNILNGQVH